MIRQFFFMLVLTTPSILSAEEPSHAKVFMGIDQADEDQFGFALTFADKLLHDKRLLPQKPAVEVLVLGEAFSFLIEGKSSIDKKVKEFAAAKLDFKLVGCGKAVSTMKDYVKSGKVQLLPTVELVDSCDSRRAELIKAAWYEVEIPSSE